MQKEKHLQIQKDSNLRMGIVMLKDLMIYSHSMKETVMHLRKHLDSMKQKDSVMPMVKDLLTDLVICLLI